MLYSLGLCQMIIYYYSKTRFHMKWNNNNDQDAADFQT